MDAVSVELPDGLAVMPPGPALATTLSTVDITVLDGPRLSIVLAAQGRQRAHEDARLLAAAVELSKVPWDCPGTITREQADEFGADQVAFALTISRRAAEKLLDLGLDLLDRLPMVYQALLAGRIDYGRALAFSDALSLLDTDTARRIATDLLAKAEVLTSGLLRERLRYRAGRADPDLARKRQQASVAQRRVFIQLDSEGTARLSGINLPPDRAAAAEDRIDRLARAARADGDPRNLDQLRADAMLDVLTGIAFRLHPHHDPVTAQADQTAATEQAQRLAQLHANQPTTPEPHADADGDGDGDGAARLEGTSRPGLMPGSGVCRCGGVRPAERRGTVDVIVKLSTLIFLDEDPGWIPGWGPVIADIARQIAFDQVANPAWKWSATNDSGQLLHHGHTRRRPTAAEAAFIKARDRTCRAPGCRRPATRCDLDHRLDHARHGPSHRGNQCCECRHHHRLKHEKQLTVHQIGLSGFMWEAPDGRLYLVPGEGNILAIDDQDDGHGWDLDNAQPAREVRQIIPITTPEATVDGNTPPDIVQAC